MIPQNTDGQPHFAYFDVETQLSFIWDGHSENVEVSHGGYGEPVIDDIHITQTDQTIEATARGWMDWFRSVCITYIVLREKT